MAVEWWKAQRHAFPLLLTLTLAHSMGDDLRLLQVSLQKCWRRLWAGKPGKKLRAALGMEHYVRGADATHGTNGWHPHWHCIVFVKRQPPESAVSMLKARWHAVVTKVLGRHYAPSWANGADLRACRKREYIAKLGLELVSARTKKGRRGGLNPWAIARAAADGEQWAVELWHAYTRAMKGVRQLVWSRELRKAAALGGEKTDQEIVDAVDNDAQETLIASVPVWLWYDIAAKTGARFALLRAGELRGRMGIAETLALYAWGLSPPEHGEDPDQLTLDLFESIAPREDARPLITRAAA